MLKKDKFALDSEAWCNLNCPDLAEKDADVVIFGIPYDKGVSYRGGAAEGPDCLRQTTPLRLRRIRKDFAPWKS